MKCAQVAVICDAAALAGYTIPRERVTRTHLFVDES